MKRIFLLLLAAPAFAGTPKVQVRETRYDFGLIVQGNQARHSFVIENEGGAPLEIQSVNTSCGCTAAMPADKIVPPGGKSRIDVAYDSRGKMGEVDKKVRVWTNDAETPLVVLTLAGRVVPSDHPEITGTQNLFQGTCAACHAAPAAGKRGEDLFNAACAMCHVPAGADGKRVGPAAETMGELSKGTLTKTITHGKRGTSMPAFGLQDGGPLDEAQVKSLVRFIKSVKK